MKEDFLGLTANLSVSPKKLDLKRLPQRQALGYLAQRKRFLWGIVQSNSEASLEMPSTSAGLSSLITIGM